MADTNTPTVNLVKPEIGASKDTWGQKTNDNWDKVDAAIKGIDEELLTLATGVASLLPTGTRLLFQQSTAPAGWTKDTSFNNRALRIVSGNVVNGGTVPFTTAFAAQSVSGSTNTVATAGTVGDTALSLAQIPYHSHYIANETNGVGALTNGNYLNEQAQAGSSNGYILKGSTTVPYIGLTSPAGSGAAHGHSFSGSAHAHTFSGSVDLAVQYVDAIIAVRN
jgi:hypothetical protein